ncbi:hypothetical protein BCV69DRAFT_280279 [Microstroma glucosiphilum]|uniref:Uncharacterized protein n=1 Tax=Pseudomicrostroma glucosiphilum TaxID=1684307 RepID=A0A316UBR7_9BASI|nr:hypothetical protein BCV69DRAFT_280279 [Pseudomicrostroma glucosiphilum]PWN22677.1 hypothetical protein BCV69DRAFT_280279 [Pseudomicrostroma glucosiphilum]
MSRGKKSGFEFLCCAIPLINVGAYVTVVEIAIVAFLVGILALAPSYSIVAGLGVIPSFGKAIVSALGFVTAVWQIVGLVAVRKEATKLYHAYTRITTLLTLAILAATIAFLVVAATQHDTAQSACNASYGATPATTSSGYTSSAISENFGDQICDYFIWAQIGAMGGLILLLGLTQLYMCFALGAYGRAQRRATRDYKTVGAGAPYESAPDDSYPLTARNAEGKVDSGVWEDSRRNSFSADAAYGAGHNRAAGPANRYTTYGDATPGYSSGIATPQNTDGDIRAGYGAPAGYPTGNDSHYGSGADYQSTSAHYAEPASGAYGAPAAGQYGPRTGASAPYETYHAQ